MLVDPGDAEGLRNALASLLTDSDLCRRIGTAGHDWVSRNYTSEAMALKYRQMYDEVLGTPTIATVAPRTLDQSGTLMRGAREFHGTDSAGDKHRARCISSRGKHLHHHSGAE